MAGSTHLSCFALANGACLIQRARMSTPNVYCMDHPLILHHLTELRDETTTPRIFRANVNRLATLLAYEATQDLQISERPVKTPVTHATGHALSERIGLIPILRAGLGMVDPVLELIPDAEVWHLGMYRDEKTFQTVEYYQKLPEDRPVDVGMIVDPMLATGGSAIAALEAVTAWGAGRTKLLAIIASPEGTAAIQEKFPDTQIYVCAIDEKLNANKYIVPGLGDAGDRIFNT